MERTEICIIDNHIIRDVWYFTPNQGLAVSFLTPASLVHGDSIFYYELIKLVKLVDTREGEITPLAGVVFVC